MLKENEERIREDKILIEIKGMKTWPNAVFLISKLHMHKGFRLKKKAFRLKKEERG